MKHLTIKNQLLATAITLGLAPPALAVTDEDFKALQEQFNILAGQVEENSQNNRSDTTIGGYGELHYNNLSNGAGTDKKVIDLHRFVIFINHEFNNDIRFFSEFEIEHAFIADNNDGSGDTSPGEVEVEQAYVQFDLWESSKIDAGVFLIPVGILNETHEPPTFYGVERNPVETNIIPVTWWEGGAMFSSRFDSGISYDIALTSGLDDGTNIRGGRQKTAKATANNLAIFGRIKYTGMRGLEAAATVSLQDNMTQGYVEDPQKPNPNLDNVEGATLIEAHARYNLSDFTLTALYAQWDIKGAGASATEKNKQNGGYLEASYKITPKWGIFARQNHWDNGGIGDTKKTQSDIGFNYWPHEDVVIKADYQAQNNIAGNFDGFNLGVGYQF